MSMDPEAADLAGRIRRRWDSLTKPPGSLGRLEEMVVRYGVIRGEAMPRLERKAIYIFCGDHGVARAGVSAYPQEVTRQMVANFLRGGAAINVLCRHYGIQPIVVNAGVAGEPIEGAVDCRVGPGTADFLAGPAMTRSQAEQALEAGRSLAREAARCYDVCGLGEMGIANTTSAAALLCALSGLPAEECVGRGTGVDEAGLERKVAAVRRAMELHRPRAGDPVGVLAAVGGFEIAEMAGFILGAAPRRLPVVVDGFIGGAAALVARAIEPKTAGCLIFSHRSAERGHRRLLELLGAEPYLELGMRLGEGTGAALAIGLLEAALALYRGMATFAEAGVSGAGEGG